MSFDVNFGNWIPNDEFYAIVDKCTKCGDDLCEGYEAIESDEGDIFCSIECFIGFLHDLDLPIWHDNQGFESFLYYGEMYDDYVDIAYNNHVTKILT